MITDHESGAMTVTYEKQNQTTAIAIRRFLPSGCISSLAHLATIKTLCAMVMIVARKLRKTTAGPASHDCIGIKLSPAVTMRPSRHDQQRNPGARRGPDHDSDAQSSERAFGTSYEAGAPIAPAAEISHDQLR